VPELTRSVRFVLQLLEALVVLQLYPALLREVLAELALVER
jgi:hypothetical protein